MSRERGRLEIRHMNFLACLFLSYFLSYFLLTFSFPTCAVRGRGRRENDFEVFSQTRDVLHILEDYINSPANDNSVAL
jgi:hypothetical protein